jgi:hypothetical protein
MENIFIIVTSIVLFYIAFKFRLRTKKIAKNGTQVEGVVFDVVESSDINSRAKYPIIRFVTSKKEWITEQYNVSTLPGLFKKGQQVIVVYNPDNPKEFFVKSAITSIVPILVILMAIIILAIGICKLLHVQL